MLYLTMNFGHYYSVNGGPSLFSNSLFRDFENALTHTVDKFSHHTYTIYKIEYDSPSEEEWKKNGMDHVFLTTECLLRETKILTIVGKKVINVVGDAYRERIDNYLTKNKISSYEIK